MNIHERQYESLRKLVDDHLHSLVKQNSPKDVSDACRYVLSAGGKRVRAVLVLLSCKAVGGNVRDALDASAAIELMHNFTLVHDDIMDNAASRRGKPTVHTQWNTGTALLAGDVLLGLAYRKALNTNSGRLQRILNLFTNGLIGVCEGQALDLEFERRSDVTVRDYFEMIGKKTGKLIATSTELGAIIGQGTDRQVTALRQFGHYLGRAFQLQDDLLDVVAEEKAFGKTIGGDIVEGKKTFLLLQSLERARGRDRRTLMRVMNRKASAPLRNMPERKREIESVTAIYESTGTLDAARTLIRQNTTRAESMLQSLPASRAQGTLLWLSNMLLQRKH
ncbi:MAG: polyprenyl synthetase family protein [Ignavibacteriae bacterium]|nr:polyprenyl synthetase family protein [Ignavibacteriota bacterium]